ATNTSFTAGLVTYGPYYIHHPVFTNPDDGDCNDWDTLTFEICGLEEAQYYFRVYAIDRNGNVSEYSNLVNTRFDNTPPAPVSIDSINSYATCTEEMKIEVCWRQTTDAGIGVDEYNIYRSDTPGVLGTVVGTVDHSPLISAYCWTDVTPNSTNNFRDNFYTISALDNFGLENISGIQRGFGEGTPPYPVRIDTVYPQFISGEMHIVIEWSDTTPPDYGTGGIGNSYRVEHTGDVSWLCIGDPDIIDIEEPTYAHTMVLPRSIIMGSPNRFFHIATIDPWGNESGYSQPYQYTDSSWAADSIVMHLYHGWNMVGLPLLPVSLYYRDIFPSVMGDALTYSAGAGFITMEDLEIGYGYWVYNPGDMDIEVLGYRIPYLNRELPQPGYYMVSGITDTTGFSITPESALSVSNVIWYNPETGTYEFADELEPGKGYWILVEGDCQYDVPGGTRKQFNYQPQWSAEILVNEQPLIFGIGSNNLDVKMPPSPPEKVLPSLLSETGENMIVDFSEHPEWTIRLPEKARLVWNSSQNATAHGLFIYTSSTVVNMSEQNDIILDAGEYKLVWDNVYPEKFEVSTHPNPFNSRMQISLSVPDEDYCEVNIISVDGKKVRNLWSGKLSAGKHTFHWNGSNDKGEQMPCGIYLVRTQLGNSVINKRILFLK
ncbi:hypothetical protein DRQ33_00885, partial [bacterium]